MGQRPTDKLGALTDREAGEWVIRLCRAVRETLGAERVIVWLYDAPAQTVSPYALDSPDDLELVEALARWADTPLDSFPAACDMLLAARPVEIADAQDDARVPPELAADLLLESLHFEPILAGRPVGMLSIEPASAGARPELHSLIPVVAAGVGRVSSLRETDRERKKAEFLLRLTEAADEADSIDELLATVCERIAREVGARRGTIFLRQGERLPARATRNADGSYDSAVWERMRGELAPGAVEAAVQSARPVVARDAGSPMIPSSWAESFGVSSAIAVPLKRDTQVIGALMLDDPAPGKFSDEEVELAAEAAERVAPTIEQALESDERTSHLRVATAIRRLLEEGAGAVSVKEAGEVLARVTRDALEAEHATLLLQDTQERIGHVISVGADDRFEQLLRERIESTPATDLRIWRLTTRQPKPIFVENARASRLLPADLVENLGLQSYLAVPLLSASGPLGLVICSHSSEPRRWSNEERQLVSQIALEGSLVVENAVLRAAEQERLGRLTHQAFHDSLTKLPNRALFTDRLQHALDRMSRRQESIAVLFLDLDAFKPINDSFGHEAGDRLLVAVSRRLQSCLRPEDTIARLGGDEFTVLLEDITDVRYAIRVAERIADSLKTPITLDGHEASVTASIGIAVSTGRESTPDELLRNSDRAMYEAKDSGKARYVVYHEGMKWAGHPGRPPAQDGAGAAEEEPAVSEPTAGQSEAVEAQAVEHADVLEEEPPPSEEAKIIEGAGLFERTEKPGAEEATTAEEPAAIEEPGSADDAAEEPPPVKPPGEDGSGQPGPALSEARRRRRLRFPPR
jgi:diguanylate cyclase (GGDEF)-like protein